MQSKRADIRIINSETLSDNWYNLKKYTFDLQRSDGDWQRQEREVYDRGNITRRIGPARAEALKQREKISTYWK